MVIRWMSSSAACLLGSLIGFAPALAQDQETAPPTVEVGSEVSLEYTLFSEDGTRLETNVGKDPLVFRLGAEPVLPPALDNVLVGLKVGERRRVILPPEKAYGVPESDSLHEIALELVPEESRRVGELLMADDGEGNERPVRVYEVRANTIVVDINHPLAGKTLTFEIRITGIAR